MPDEAPHGRCSLCDAPIIVYRYSRPGPAPGSMKVCSNSACVQSVEGMKRAALARLERCGNQVIVSEPVSFASAEGHIYPKGTPEYEAIKAKTEAALLERPEASQ